MTSVSVKCFGVGDGAACGDRNHSAYLYRVGGAVLLFDCGEPISRSFKAAGLSYDLIDRLFVSHLHADHFGGFFMLMQGFWLEKRKKNLPVHLPADGIAPVRQMLEAGYLFEELLQFALSLEPLVPECPVVQGDVRVTPFRTTHLDGLRRSFQKKYPGAYTACSFLIEADGVRLGHSADLGTPEDLAPLLAQPLDLLVCELAHFQPEALFARLKNHPIKRLVLTHLSRHHWEKIKEVRALAARALPEVQITFASDQQVIEF